MGGVGIRKAAKRQGQAVVLVIISGATTTFWRGVHRQDQDPGGLFFYARPTALRRPGHSSHEPRATSHDATAVRTLYSYEDTCNGGKVLSKYLAYKFVLLVAAYHSPDNGLQLRTKYLVMLCPHTCQFHGQDDSDRTYMAKSSWGFKKKPISPITQPQIQCRRYVHVYVAVLFVPCHPEDTDYRRSMAMLEINPLSIVADYTPRSLAFPTASRTEPPDRAFGITGPSMGSSLSGPFIFTTRDGPPSWLLCWSPKVVHTTMYLGTLVDETIFGLIGQAPLPTMAMGITRTPLTVPPLPASLLSFSLLVRPLLTPPRHFTGLALDSRWTIIRF
ncbi:hypothetical protein ACRALDRAFT_2018678 [Sodiomyces alcalophilus JCM 7366]|uniref:uncharacterized protein n=1 Tax=Sodiomyces alcalophilus JCM 7366 TaxID=591952 RepID=UPI0039B6562E